MAYNNNMTNLLNKIERRLGTKVLNLPEDLQKDKWVEILDQETLETFSYYFPHKITMDINSSICKKKGDYYILDEDLFKGIKIIGIKDIAWNDLGNTKNQAQYGAYDMFATSQSLYDLANIQMLADHFSLLNYGMYVDFIPPNKLRIINSNGMDMVNSINNFRVDVFLKHSTNLTTIDATKMEIFTSLAISDIASFLYEQLKYYDDLPTVFGANVDLKMSEMQEKASRRETIIEELKNSYVSASNYNQPIMMTI